MILVTAAAIWLIFYKPGDFLKPVSGENKRDPDKPAFDRSALLLPIIALIFLSVVTNFCKDGLQTWVPVILKKMHGMKDEHSILLTLILPLFGVFGASAAVIANKKIKSIISLVLLFSGFTALFNTIVILFKDNLIVTLVCFGFLELFLHGSASAIVSIFPLSMREKISSGVLAGILNGCAYLGSGLSSYVLGKIADVTGGWDSVFFTLLGAACSMLLFGGVCETVIRKRAKRKAN